jgi:hypothetical protein
VLVLLVLSLVGGVVVGVVRGGTLDALGRIRVFLPVLFVLAGVVLLVGWAVPSLYSAAWVFATGLLALFAAANPRLPGLPLLLAGLALNALVIVANGGQMPVSSWATDQAGAPSQVIQDARHEPADRSTVLRPATDVIPLAFPGVPAVVSAGDVLAAAGLALFGASAPVRARRTLDARRSHRRREGPGRSGRAGRAGRAAAR